MKNQLVITDKDNVFVSLSNDDSHIRGHKYAKYAIRQGEPIIKYGHRIGIAKEDISEGQHVHVNNTATALGDIDAYTYSPVEEVLSKLGANETTLPEQLKSFDGYKRKNGDVGIRNELWVIPTVGCVNGVAMAIIESFKEACLDSGIALKQLDWFDGVYRWNHEYGCSQMGDDHANTRITLQNIASHPNAGGVLILGLGCENNQIEYFRDTLGDYDKDRVLFLKSQEVEDEVETGVALLQQLFDKMSEDKRTKLPVSELKIGLECGGSDGLSGVTANPMVGRLSDYLVDAGGTTVLTEVPEMFGAETVLMNKCIDENIFNKTAAMINDFKAYYKRHDQVIYENPSPGNKKGGITTLEDKSLGCVMKAGNRPVMDVLKMTDRLTKSGVNLISAPGNDAVATTTLGMCGCHMVLFTTGRGTPFGGFIPTMKISTNSELAAKKKNWIDFDAGRLIQDEKTSTGEAPTLDSLALECLQLVVEIASGTKTKQEKNNYREIAIFKSGVTL